MGSATRIAYVEDDAEIARVVKFGLEVAQTFEVTLYQDAESALRGLDEPPAVLVVDVGLPDLDGIELCRRVRARFPDLPILVLTAYATERERAMEAGASDFLVKPVGIRDLRARLRLLARLP